MASQLIKLTSAFQSRRLLNASRRSAMRYNEVSTSARYLSAGDSHERRTEVRNPFCCDVAVCAEIEPTGLRQAEPQKLLWLRTRSVRRRSFWNISTGDGLTRMRSDASPQNSVRCRTKSGAL